MQIHRQGEIFSPIAEISVQISITNQRQILERRLVLNQIQQQEKEEEARREEFFEYCRQWWEQFKKFEVSQDRIIKIFGEDDRGGMVPLV